MGEDDDGRGFREAGKIPLQPRELLGTDVGPSLRDVVERDEVDPAMVEGVVAVAEGVANDVLELDSGLALPLHEECVLDVDLAARRIVVAPGFADPG